MRAKDIEWKLRETYANRCNPDEPLRPDDERNVDIDELNPDARGVSVVDTIAERIEISKSPVCELFSGLPGSGKSTELRRLVVSLTRVNAVASPRPENLGRLASCLLDRAQIVSLYDRRPTARIDVEEAIRVVRAAVDMAAGDDDPNLRLAEYVETSGDIDFQVGDRVGAGAAYREALTLRKELLSRYPAERSFDCLVAQCLLRAGLAAWAADGADAAMSACTEAVGRLRTLALDGWGAAIYKHVLALHLGNLGDLHRDRGDPARAARVYQESLQLCVELQKKEPENAYWQDTLAMSWARWARYCEQEEGSLTDALAAWQNARELLEGLLRVAPARRDWEQLLSESTAEVGRLSAHPRGDPV